MQDKTQHQKPALETRPATAPLSLEFDAAEFAHFLHQTDWSDEQKAEYIALVWNIVCEFVALGWGVHPVQQARDTCGKLPVSGAESASSEAVMVDSSYGELVGEFMRLNGSEPGSVAGGAIDE